MTGLDPDVRFAKHKAGIQANRCVKTYGLRWLSDRYEVCAKEVEMGADLREAGFGVRQA